MWDNSQKKDLNPSVISCIDLSLPIAYLLYVS